MEKKEIKEKSKGFIKEFGEFIKKGNVVDMAVGVVIGGAFSAIVTSLVNDIIMPVISLITGGIDFSNWFVALDGNKYATLEEATTAGAATLNYGNLISFVINFVIEEKPEAPKKSDEVLLLEDIRDLLKKNK